MSRDVLRGGAAEVMAARILKAKASVVSSSSPGGGSRSSSSLNPHIPLPPTGSPKGGDKYSAMRQKLAEANERANKAGENISALKKSNEAQSRGKIQRLHREVWLAELARLEDERLRTEASLSALRDAWLGIAAPNANTSTEEGQETENLDAQEEENGSESGVEHSDQEGSRADSGRATPVMPDVTRFNDAGLSKLSESEADAAKSRLANMVGRLTSLDMSLDAHAGDDAVMHMGAEREDIDLGNGAQSGIYLTAVPEEIEEVKEESHAGKTREGEVDERATLPRTSSQKKKQSTLSITADDPLSLASFAPEIDRALDDTEEQVAIIEEGPLAMRTLVHNFAGQGCDEQSAMHIRSQLAALIAENEAGAAALGSEATALIREVKGLEVAMAAIEGDIWDEVMVEGSAGVAGVAVPAPQPPSSRERQGLASPLPTPPRHGKRGSANGIPHPTSPRRASAVRDLPTLDARPEGDGRYAIPNPVMAELQTCPEPALVDAVKAQYEELHREERTRLRDLDESYKGIAQDPYGGWGEEDYERYRHIVAQYSTARPMSAMLRGMTLKQLMEDRLLLELPHRTKLDLIRFERWEDANRFYREKRDELVVTYRREREALTRQVLLALRDAKAMHAKRLASKEEEEALTAVRIQLMQRLLVLRQEKLDALAAAAAIEERRHAELEAWEKKEKERQRVARAAIQKEIQHFKQQKKALEEERQRRLEELQRQQEEEDRRVAALNEERVRFRREEEDRKRALKQEEQERLEAEEAERQRRLQSLIDTVRVEAEADTARLTGHTKASKAAEEVGVQEKERIMAMAGEIRRFQQTTFADDKVTNDRRFRLEKAIQAAGLGGSEYARTILNNVQPNKPARKDMSSTLFKPSGGFT